MLAVSVGVILSVTYPPSGEPEGVAPPPAERATARRSEGGRNCVKIVTVAKPLPNLEMPPRQAEVIFRLQDAGLYGLEGRHFLLSGDPASRACGRTIMVKHVSIDTVYVDKEWTFSLTITNKDASGCEHGDEYLSRASWRALVAEGRIREVAWPPQRDESGAAALTFLW